MESNIYLLEVNPTSKENILPITEVKLISWTFLEVNGGTLESQIMRDIVQLEAS